jgi:hypothetical protein
LPAEVHAPAAESQEEKRETAEEKVTASHAKPVTEKQIHRLYAIAHSQNWTRGEVTHWMQRQIGKLDPHALTRTEYDKVCNFLLSGGAKEELNRGN